jgi:hypothetical protein
MTQRNNSDSVDTKSRAPLPRWRKETWLALGCILFGLLVLPGLIYMVGVQLLAAYSGGPHIGSFYGDYFRNLTSGTGRTWLIVLSPYLFLMVLRGIFFRWGNLLPAQTSDEAGSAMVAPPSGAQRESTGGRREPFIAP